MNDGSYPVRHISSIDELLNDHYLLSAIKLAEKENCKACMRKRSEKQKNS